MRGGGKSAQTESATLRYVEGLRSYLCQWHAIDAVQLTSNLRSMQCHWLRGLCVARGWDGSDTVPAKDLSRTSSPLLCEHLQVGERKSASSRDYETFDSSIFRLYVDETLKAQDVVNTMRGNVLKRAMKYLKENGLM